MDGHLEFVDTMDFDMDSLCLNVGAITVVDIAVVDRPNKRRVTDDEVTTFIDEIRAPKRQDRKKRVVWGRPHTLEIPAREDEVPARECTTVSVCASRTYHAFGASFTLSPIQSLFVEGVIANVGHFESMWRQQFADDQGKLAVAEFIIAACRVERTRRGQITVHMLE